MPNLSEEELYSSRRQREFEERIDRAFDPQTRHSLSDSGEISTGGDGGKGALFAALDALANDEEIPDMRPGPRFTDEELDAIRAELLTVFDNKCFYTVLLSEQNASTLRPRRWKKTHLILHSGLEARST